MEGRSTGQCHKLVVLVLVALLLLLGALVIFYLSNPRPQRGVADRFPGFETQESSLLYPPPGYLSIDHWKYLIRITNPKVYIGALEALGVLLIGFILLLAFRRNRPFVERNKSFITMVLGTIIVLSGIALGYCQGRGSLHISSPYATVANPIPTNPLISTVTPQSQLPQELTADQVIAGAKAFDFDQDGSTNYYDNCPEIANHYQLDDDKNGKGDACENPVMLVPTKSPADDVKLTWLFDEIVWGPEYYGKLPYELGSRPTIRRDSLLLSKDGYGLFERFRTDMKARGWTEVADADESTGQVLIFTPDNTHHVVLHIAVDAKNKYWFSYEYN